MRKLIIALLLLSPLAACNTISGIGQDVSTVGDAVEGAAEESK
jgi:predicted small secreted protein